MKLKGNKLAAAFRHSSNLSTFLFCSKKCHEKQYLIWFLMMIPKNAACHFCTFCILKVIGNKQNNSTFVRFSYYYLNIHLWGHYIEIALP
jgi:hypothetical protein